MLYCVNFIAMLCVAVLNFNCFCVTVLTLVGSLGRGLTDVELLASEALFTQRFLAP